MKRYGRVIGVYLDCHQNFFLLLRKTITFLVRWVLNSSLPFPVKKWKPA